MARRVVEVAGDAGPLLCAREAPLALGVAFGPTCPLFRGRHPLVALPDAIAREPGDRPETTVPANTPGPNPLRTTDGTSRTATLPTRAALRSSCGVRSGQRATV